MNSLNRISAFAISGLAALAVTFAIPAPAAAVPEYPAGEIISALFPDDSIPADSPDLTAEQKAVADTAINYMKATVHGDPSAITYLCSARKNAMLQGMIKDRHYTPKQIYNIRAQFDDPGSPLAKLYASKIKKPLPEGFSDSAFDTIKSVSRVKVSGKHAVFISDLEDSTRTTNLVKESGVWKIDR